jgi:threonine/homoserine/homoserine lactone efflux protein
MTTHFGLFLLAAALLAVMPGPGIFYVAARTLGGGRRDGLLSIGGTTVGGLVQVAACALGVSALLLASAEAFTALKIAGALYLIWLGIGKIREAGAPLDLLQVLGGRAFRDGVLVEALNPKTAAFFLAFLPQFIDPAHGAAWQFAFYGTISVALNSLADLVVALTAARTRSRVLARPRLMRNLQRASGATLCGLGVSLLVARRG